MAKIDCDIQEAITLLNDGQPVAIPTETVYGLAANALDESAVVKIFKAKGRPDYNPLIMHIGNIEDLKIYAKEVSNTAQFLAEKFWPGPLTLILPKRDIVPDVVTSGLPTVGIRMPGHEMTLELLRNLNFPLAAPSANPFGYISPTTAAHVNEQLGDKISYILDGGKCPKGLESTIIGFENRIPVIYRLGAITSEEIETVIGYSITTNNKAEIHPIGPGMLPFHYAPMTPMILSDNIADEASRYHGQNIGVIAFQKELKQTSIQRQIILSTAGNIQEAGSNLYEALRALDKEGLDFILVEKFKEEGLGKTINDRLKRAAAKVQYAEIEQ